MVNNDKKCLLLLGGGHSQVEVLRQFARRPMAGIDVVLVSRDPCSIYSGMLPGYIAGHYHYEECFINLEPLARAAGVTFIQGDVNEIDLENKSISCSTRREIHFDVISINTGSASAVNLIAGADAHAIRVKPVNSFGENWQGLLDKIETATRPLNIAVIGGGAGGVELLLAINYRHHQIRSGKENVPAHRFHLFTDSDELLPTHHARVRNKLTRIMMEQDVELYLNRRITGISSTGLECDDGSEFSMDHVLLATQASAPEWIKNSGLDTDHSGFVLVNDFLQSRSHPQVFAAGDISTSASQPRPKSGVNAVRQGPVLAENLSRFLAGQALKPYTPQKNFLALISCGDKYAVASRGSLVMEGRWLWTLKDWIDRRHIRKYSY